MKYCPMCKTDLNENLFNKGSAIDGLQSYCKSCMKIRNRSKNPIYFTNSIPDLIDEIWKPIPMSENKYLVSNMGRVKSCNRTTKIKDGREFFRKGKLLKPYINKTNGYSYVVLGYNKKSSPIHRIVANSFIPNSENKPQVNHINGIKSDNRVENLEWVTQSENNKHAYFIGLKKGRGKSKKNTHISHNLISRISSPLNEINI